MTVFLLHNIKLIMLFLLVGFIVGFSRSSTERCIA